MRDAQRRDRFIAWFMGKPCAGDRAKLIRLTQLSKGRISQLLDPAQPFGERVAANLARKLHLPEDFFDAPAPIGGIRLSVVDAPPPPPPDFRDRHLVTDSDWATLNAVKLLMSEEELAELRARAKRFEARARQQIEELAKAAELAKGKPKQ